MSGGIYTPFSPAFFGLPGFEGAAPCGRRGTRCGNQANMKSFLDDFMDVLDDGMVEFVCHLSKKEQEKKQPENYHLKLHVGAEVKPEDVKLSLKGNVLTVEIKHEQLSEDGTSRVYQEISKKYTVPEGVDLTKLESALTPEGVLKLQAPYKPKPKEEEKPEAKAAMETEQEPSVAGPSKKREPVEIPISIVAEETKGETEKAVPEDA